MRHNKIGTQLDGKSQKQRSSPWNILNHIQVWEYPPRGNNLAPDNMSNDSIVVAENSQDKKQQLRIQFDIIYLLKLIVTRTVFNITVVSVTNTLGRKLLAVHEN